METPVSPATARKTSARRASWSTIFIYGIGQIPGSVKDGIFQFFFFFYFTEVVGIDPLLVGIGNLIIMFSDAISDPIMGHISDHFRHQLVQKWGRRHLFMLIGILPLAFSFAMLFNLPQGLSEWQQWFWMVGFAIAIRTSLTIQYVPYLALGAEISEDYNQRTTVTSIRTLFGYCAALFTIIAGLLFYLSPTEIFPDGRFNESQYALIGYQSAVLAIIAGLITVFGTMHVIPNLPNAPTEKKPWYTAYVELARALKMVSFTSLIATFIVFAIAGGLTATLTMTTTTYYWELSGFQIIFYMSTVVFASFLAVFIVPIFERLFDKKGAYIICIVMVSIFWTLPVNLNLLGLMPPIGSTATYILLIIMVLFSNVFMSGIYFVSASMLADVTDEYEWRTGKRQEGLFFAAKSFGIKVTFGIGGFIAGLTLKLINWQDRTAGLAPGDVPADILRDYGLIIGPLLFVMAISSLFILFFYKLDKKKHAHILAKLKERRT